MTNDSSTETTPKPAFPIALFATLVLVLFGGALTLTIIRSGDSGSGDTADGPSNSADWNAIFRAEGSGEYEHAIDLCLNLADRDSDKAGDSRAYAGRIAIDRLGQFSRGEELVLQALDNNPENRRLLSCYVYLLTMSGQRWESLPHLSRFVVSYDNSVPELIWLSDATVVVTDWDLLEFARQSSPRDPLPLLGLAWNALVDRPEDAVRFLQECLRVRPDMITAQALLGRALLESGDEEAFRQWDRDLPNECQTHPAVWSARGKWWRDRDHAKALRCYLECCRRAPNDPQANWQISLLLQQFGETDAASVFRHRFDRLVEYGDLVREVREKNDLSVTLDAARLAEELLRPAEAFGWYRLAIAQGLGGQADLTRMQRLNDEGLLAIVSAFEPDNIIDRTRWPIPAPGSSSDESDSFVNPEFGSARFRDVAASMGLEFQYFNGVQPGNRLEFLHTVNGGGIGAVDFDGDGWPDLFFTQGGHSPINTGLNTTYYDRLFRNISGIRATDVTASARIVEPGYGQGCTVGDFDCDGFPDIFVANIGANRLLHNCGDGTFQDVTEESGVKGDAWTSSCALADLNSDSWPDLYEVRYVATEDLFHRQCFDSHQVPRPCPPKEFSPVEDVVWLSTGDGGFTASSPASGGASRAGRGLGLIVADFDQQPGLDVFVGNDGTADFLLINRTAANAGMLRFDDEAILRGVAANGEGNMQASMGIAFGDVDRDGQPDLFQTNFRGEPNTLYLGVGDGLFNDATTRSRLRAVSVPMLGWGTAFVDTELDGWPDLIVLNGHLEDRRHLGDPYRMRTQVYRNVGNAEFVEVDVASVGPWFTEPRLARTVATLDWNQDGREDFAVSNLDSPAALLIGEADPVGNHISIHLRGVASTRDAIGASVTIEAGNERWVEQILAGDGYQTSHERTILLGLGAQTQIDRITVRWPSNHVQVFESIAVNQEIVVIEGRKLLMIANRSLH